MASKARLLAIVVLAVVVVRLVLAVPIISFRQTRAGNTPCCQACVDCGVTLFQVTGTKSVSHFLFGYGGEVVNGTYHFG